MEITLKEITIGELTNGYNDLGDRGVFSMENKLNIRPAYQREFVYGDNERNAVINTVTKGFPLNVMYWSDNENGTFEVLDGQQRTISVCQYVNGDFSFNGRYFHNLQEDEQEKILNYKLQIYICVGSPSEKLDWFRTINIQGKPLTEQELRNAVYTGAWLASAKEKFSKPNCPAQRISKDYVKGSPNRQELLEKALRWISNGDIESYMAKHQHDTDCDELWQYFVNVITWIEKTFTIKRAKLMQTTDWGKLYNEYKHAKTFDPEEVEKQIKKLLLDDDVTNKNGIYSYIITDNEKSLNIRTFTESQRIKLYEQQNGICPICGEHFEIEQMDADHITPWSKGGQTSLENGQMLCKHCNRTKSNK